LSAPFNRLNFVVRPKAKHVKAAAYVHSKACRTNKSGWTWKKSQRNFINQPGVGAQRLRRVVLK
jgi:hypothetical protein